MTLKVVNLSKRYKDRWVLRDVSFEVPAGEIFGLCGLSGSGKTTLLKAIAGRVPRNGGEVFNAGVVLISSQTGRRRGSVLGRLLGRQPDLSTTSLKSLLH